MAISGFQYRRRAWTREEWELPSALQGLGPDDVEDDEAPE